MNKTQIHSDNLSSLLFSSFLFSQSSSVDSSYHSIFCKLHKSCSFHSYPGSLYNFLCLFSSSMYLWAQPYSYPTKDGHLWIKWEWYLWRRQCWEHHYNQRRKWPRCVQTWYVTRSQWEKCSCCCDVWSEYVFRYGRRYKWLIMTSLWWCHIASSLVTWSILNKSLFVFVL